MISRFNVIYSPEAKNDLRSIASYILFELKAPQAAQNVTTRIRNEIRSLEEMPERYPIVEWEPWASMRMNKVPVGKYVVFYTVDSDSSVVSIIRIFYGGRNIEGIIQGNESDNN